MKIGIYYPRALLGDGGATSSMRGWAAALAAAGFDVVVLCLPTDGAAAGLGLEVRPIEHRAVAGQLIPVGLERAIHDIDLMWLHSGWVGHNVVAAKVARRTRTPYLITPQGAYQPSVLARRSALKHVWWAALESRITAGAAAIHVHFDAEVDDLRRRGFRGNVIVVPNGADVPDAPTWDGGSGGFALWLGRYDIECKGLDILLQALASLPQSKRPEVRLHGPDFRSQKRALSEMVEDLGLAGSVLVGDPVYGQEKERLLRSARLFLFPSRWDSHSAALTEAAVAGLPIVTTTTTHFGRALADRGGAIAVPPNPSELGGALLRGLADDGSALSRRVHAVMRESFSWPGVGVTMRAALGSVI